MHRDIVIRVGMVVAPLVVLVPFVTSARSVRARSLLQAQCPAGGCEVTRSQDAFPSDVYGVFDTWFEYPTPCIRSGIVRHFTRVVSSDLSTGAFLEIGVLASPTITPTVYSLCQNCFGTEDHPIPEGWNALSNHGRPVLPIDLIIWFDAESSSWVWYVNGEQVRREYDTQMADVARVAVGANTTVVDNALGVMWHNNVGWISPEAEPNDLRLYDSHRRVMSHFGGRFLSAMPRESSSLVFSDARLAQGESTCP